jgi:hypothetical protein
MFHAAVSTNTNTQKEKLASGTSRYRGKMFGTSRLDVSLKATAVTYVSFMKTNFSFSEIAMSPIIYEQFLW